MLYQYGESLCIVTCDLVFCHLWNFLLTFKLLNLNLIVIKISIKIIPDMRGEFISVSGSLSLLYFMNILRVFWKLGKFSLFLSWILISAINPSQKNDWSQIASKYRKISFQMILYFALIREKITEKKAVCFLMFYYL